MALQSSGAISLNDIHVEAGGTTGTPVNLNDSDVRDLINASAGSTMDFSDWYGASASDFLTDLVSQTSVTVTQGDTGSRFSTIRYYGFYGSTGADSGSVSPTTLTFSSPNTSLDIIYAARGPVIIPGQPEDPSASAFWFGVKNVADLSIRPVNTAITGVTLDITGGTVTLAQSDSTFVDSETIGVYWVWFANDFTSSEHTNFISEWDGSGNTTMVVNT
jgi:hypothetical protein|tara:strand:+ start:1716 stop:2369 length:654 start_codon:yes stop_codon:yes gene_type:complete